MDSFQEGAYAKQWRERRGLSRRQLAELTGYSERAIANFEYGATNNKKSIPLKSFQTYRMACAAIALGINFDWNTLTVKIKNGVLTIK